MRKGFIGCLFGFCFLVVIYWFAVNGIGSLRWLRSPAQIQAAFLEKVPLGSSQDSVERYIESHGFRLIAATQTTGYLSENNKEVAYLLVWLGGYQYFFSRVAVTADLGFDESNSLIVIEIQKCRDSP